MLGRDSVSLRTIVDLFARHGEHCRSARLIFGEKIPSDVQALCDRERTVFLARRDSC